MPKSAYEEIEEENQLREHQFRIYGAPGKENSIEILEPGKTYSLAMLKAGRTLQAQPSGTNARKMHLEKKNIATTTWHKAKGTAASHKLDIVNKDGEYETTIWTTTPANIKKALHSGFFDADHITNPIAKMIAQIGEYKLKVRDQYLETGTYSENFNEKNYIAETTQDCLSSLNSLHACINNYNEGLSPERNFQLILEKLKEFRTEIEKIEQRAGEEGEPYVTMREGLQKLKDKAEAYESKLLAYKAHKSLISRKDLVDNIQRPYGITLDGADVSLQHFLQEQINDLNFYSVGANNMITPAWSGLMGRDPLGKCLLEARFTGEKFSNSKIDYHNPVTAAHALDFSGMENAEGLVTIDTEKYGFSPQNELKLLKGLALLSTIDRNENILEGQKSEINTKSGFLGRVGGTISRLGGNFFKDILGFGADLVYGLGYAGYAGIQKLVGNKIVEPEFPSSHWPIFHKREAGEKETYEALKGNDLLEKVKSSTVVRKTSFVEMAFSKIYGLASMLIADPIKLFPEAMKIGSNLAVDLAHDFRGDPPLNDTQMQALLDECIEDDESERHSNQEIKKEMIAAYNSRQKELYEKFSEDSQQAKIDRYKNTGKIHPACVPYLLTPDDPCDTLSWATNDFLKELVEVFSHEIYRAHPLAGLAFSAAASTAAPMMVPSLAKNVVLHFINTQISLPIAHTFVGSETVGFMPALSTGLFQGKLAYLAVDAMNGEDSVLARGLKTAIENPVLAFSICSVAVGFGYAVAFKMHIPVLSADVADETQGASVPYIELGLTGAKIAAILIENTVNLEHVDHTPQGHWSIDDLIAQQREQLIKDLEQGYRREKGIQHLQVSDHKIIEEMYQNYCEEFKTNYRNYNLSTKTQELKNKLKTEFGEGAEFRSNISVLTKPQDEQAGLKEDIVNKLMKLDPQSLSREKARKIMDYVETNFSDDKSYVAAVKDKLEAEDKQGPLFNSLKRVLWHAGQLLTLRPLFSGIQWAFYSNKVSSLDKQCELDPQNKELMKQKKELQALSLLARGRCTGYFQSVANDFGRIVKGATSVLRKTWDLVGSMVHNIFETLCLVVPWRTGKFRSKMSKEFFAPGKISKTMDAAVGELRASATSKNLGLASRDLLVRERLKSQLSMVGRTAGNTNTQQTKPIAISRASASEVSTRYPHSSTKAVLESELAKGHGWQAQPGVVGARCKTFPRDMNVGDLDREIGKIWKAPTAVVNTVMKTHALSPLLANQTRAKEFVYQRNRALVIETLSADKADLVSKIIFSETPSAKLIYDQIKSGVEEYQRHHEPKEGEFVTITIDHSMSLELQERYLLCCIKLGCRCCDEEDREIYSPDFKKTDQITLGADLIPLGEFLEDNKTFLNANLERVEDVNGLASEATNDSEYSAGSHTENSTSLASVDEDDLESGRKDEEGGTTNHHNFHQ